jgi:hypothetical protein
MISIHKKGIENKRLSVKNKRKLRNSKAFERLKRKLNV